MSRAVGQNPHDMIAWYPCPKCGMGIEFDISNGHLQKCYSCGHESDPGEYFRKGIRNPPESWVLAKQKLEREKYERSRPQREAHRKQEREAEIRFGLFKFFGGIGFLILVIVVVGQCSK